MRPPRRLLAALAALFVVAATAVIPGSAIAASEPPATTAQLASLPNPKIDDSCGIDVTLVLDASGSIGRSESRVRDAGQAFLDALADTNSTARVIDFGTVARETAPATQVTSQSVAPGGVHRQALHEYYHPKPPIQPGVSSHVYWGGDVQSTSSYRNGSDPQYTNWDQALDLTGRESDELIVFLTDGVPTAMDSDQPGDPFYAAGQDPPNVRYKTDGSTQAADLTLDRAIEEANQAKAAGARVLAIGAGDAFSKPTAEDHLVAVSGPNVVTSAAGITDLNAVDVALVSNFSQLTAALRRVVTQLCSPSITVRKLSQTADDPTYQPAPGVEMTVEPQVASAVNPPYRWILPTPGAPVGPQSATTDQDGFANFQWRPDPVTATSTATITETVPTGEVPRDYSCQSKQSDGSVTTTSGSLSAQDTSFDVEVGPESIVTCTIRDDFSYDPELSITKTNSPTLIRGDGGGETVTSTYEVTNPGNVSMALTTPTDDRCSHVTYVSGDQPPTNGLLDPGETWTYTCDRLVQTALTDQPVNIVNHASVTGRDPRGNPHTVTTQDDVDVITPNIVVEKSADQTVVLPGTGVTYTYLVHTDGNVGLTGVTATDDKCSPLVLQSGDTGSDGVLAPGETWTYTCTAQIDVDTINTVTVEGTPPRGPAVVGTHTAHVKVDHPDLLLTKTVSQAEVLPGTPVDYTFVVSNPGDVELEPDPDRAGFVQDDHCSPVYVSGDGGFPELLEPGESWTYECQNVVITSDVRNTATIVANNTEINLTLRRQAFAEVKVRQPGIAVTKHASAGVVHSGDDVTYTYEVTNPGTTDLQDVGLTDDKCSPVTYQSGDDGDDVLQPGELWTYTCVTTLTKATPAGPPEDVTNTATVTGTPRLGQTTGPPLQGTDTATVRVIQSSITLVKDASAPEVRVGDEVTWTVTITNTGDSPVVYLGEADDHCDPLTYQSGDTGDDGIASPGEAWIYTCTENLFVDRVNEAAVVAIDPVGRTLIARDPATVTVYDPKIEITKTVDRPYLPEGETATYTFVVTNPGDDPLTPVEVGDTDCQPLVLQSGDTGSDGVLTPGEEWTYTCSAAITEAYINVALVAGLDHRNEPVVAAAAAAVLPYRPGVAVEKTASVTDLVGSGEVTYTYEVTNTGNVPLADVAEDITDDTCSPVTYVSGDEDGNGLLTGEEELFEVGPAETWVFTCTTTVDRTTTNTVTVSGTPVRPDPNGPIPLGPATTGIDTATVNVTDPPTTTTPTDPSTPTTQPTAVGGGNQTPPSSTGGGVLPRTGADLARLAISGAILALAGWALVRTRRGLATGH